MSVVDKSNAIVRWLSMVAQIKASAPCVRESGHNSCWTLLSRRLLLARDKAVAINADRVLIATAFQYQRAFHMRSVFVEEWSGGSMKLQCGQDIRMAREMLVCIWCSTVLHGAVTTSSKGRRICIRNGLIALCDYFSFSFGHCFQQSSDLLFSLPRKYPKMR